MSTESFKTLSRFAGVALSLLLSSVCVPGSACAQSTAVTSSSVVALPHPAKFGESNYSIQNTAIDKQGDFVVEDWVNGAVYDFPADGRPMITVVAPGTIIGGVGSYANMGITLDQYENMYLGANFGTEGFFSAPYDPATKTWDSTSFTEVGENAASNSYFQTAGFYASSLGFLVVGDESGNRIFKVTVDASRTFGNPVNVMTKTKSRVHWIVVDGAGNIYFAEDGIPGDGDGGAEGVFEIPAGTTGVVGESSLTRVDPGLANISGLAIDAAGNLYIGDIVQGLFMVPNEGGTVNPKDAVMLTAYQPKGSVSVDQTRGIVYMSTAEGNLPNGAQDVAKIFLNAIELGSAAVGTQSATPGIVSYSFSGAATPGSFVIEEAGGTSDFAVASGGTCAANTAQAALSSCTVNVAFTPHVPGGLSAKLLMLDGSGNILNSTFLHGEGQGSAISVTPALETPLGTALKTPSQVATDSLGNIYVADAGLGQVLMYPKGSTTTTVGTPLGAGLTAPTGVAVDGAGDVFIGDGGNVYEIPYGTTSLNTAAQTTLVSGLGSQLNLAAGALGHIFIADKTNQQVVRVGGLTGTVGVLGPVDNQLIYTGFNAPSAVSIDESGNLFVVDGANLIEIPQVGDQTTVLTNLSGSVNGMAIDSSGSLYLSQAGGAVRIPNVGGTLTPSSETNLSAVVTNPTGIALDLNDNIYIADGTAEDIDSLSASGFLNLGSPALHATATASATVVDIGNAPLNVTGVTSTDVADYSATTSCSGTPVAVGASCGINVTFNPGPGDQGPLSGMITIQSDAGNAPVVDVTGVGSQLMVSTTTVTAAANPTATSVTLTVTVSGPSGSTVTPTGTVTVTTDGLNPTVETLSNGSVTFSMPPGTVGSHVFSATYSGDSNFGVSTGSLTITIGGKGTAVITVPPIPQYILSTGNGSSLPSDNSDPIGTFVITLSAAAGNPGGSMTFWEGSTLACPLDFPTIDPAVAAGTVQPVTPDLFYDVLNMNGTLVNGSVSTIKVINTSVPSTVTGNKDSFPYCLPLGTSTISAPEIVNTHTVVPVYNGDANFNGAVLPSITFNVIRNPSVTIVSSPSTVSVAPGSSASATLTISSYSGDGTNVGYGFSAMPTVAVPNGVGAGAGGSINGVNFTLPLGLSCSNLPAHTTCSFSTEASLPCAFSALDPVTSVPTATLAPQPGWLCVMDTPTGGATMTVTFNTDVSETSASIESQTKSIGYAAMLGFGLLGLALRRRAGMRGRLVLVLCVLMLGTAVTGLTACSSTILGANQPTGTPAGTYPVTIIAQQVGYTTVINPAGGAPLQIFGNNNQMSVPYTPSTTYTVNLTIQ